VIVTGERAAWERREAGDAAFVAFTGLEAYPWVAHGMSAVAAGAEPQSEVLRRAIGLDPGRVVNVRQVHGTEVIALVGGAGRESGGVVQSLPDTRLVDDAPRLPADSAVSCAGEADAVATDRPGIALEIRVADCVPLFVIDPARRVVALAHAGWRGTLAGMGARLIEALAARFGSRPSDLRVWIGPCIGPECYEVGPEVAAPFRREFGEAAVPSERRVDLRAANRAALVRAGALPAQIETIELCTSCRPDLFHSHRASGGRPGRNVALLGIRAG
jgi:polyphenol oxidase